MDYKKLGFMCGIEIHQELDTKKLFCNCSSSMKEKGQITEIKRKMRAVAGETGMTDLAAQYEHFRDKEFIYHGYEGECCLVDSDSEPPHEVDPEAFMIALGVAKVFKLDIPDKICVMRKTVTDGSACSGFQRTMLVGLESDESTLKTSKGIVKVNQLNLEEDACKIEKREAKKTYYSLSRLGIPLLEIGTDATIKDPEHAKEVALLIGTILRSFNVKRGIGTIRQDVNISIKGGTRIEVKGWQDLKTLPLLVENEVKRQVSLLDIKEELKKRGLKKFDLISKDVTSVFKGTSSKMIRGLLKAKASIIAIVLPKFNGLLKKEICPGKTFGKELSEYAKAYGTKGMIHTDENLKKYELVSEFDDLKKLFKTGAEDLIIIIGESKKIAEKAVRSVYERAQYCLEGIPEETRIPNHHNQTSSYARPLPGAHRMYPETDVPNVPVTKDLIDSIKLPELLHDKVKRISKDNSIDEHLVKECIRNKIDIEGFIKRYKNIKPKQLAHILIDIPKDIRKRYNLEMNILDYTDEILSRLDKKEISTEGVLEILVELGKGKKVDYSKYSVMDKTMLEKEIKKIIAENKGAPMNAMIGIVMGKLRGKASGKDIVDIIRKKIS